MQESSSPYKGDLLIVDDLADNLRVLSNTLSNQGYRVRAVRDGAMALLGAKAVPPDVILLDILMPEMDGYEVCRQLKSYPQTCNIPIIFLSALDEVTDKAKAFEVGGADYISKPFQVEEVLARVHNQITIQQLKKQVAEQAQQLERISVTSLASPNLHVSSEFYHQIVSVITTIVNDSERLSQNSAIDSDQYNGLRTIHQNGQTLLSLLDSLKHL